MSIPPKYTDYYDLLGLPRDSTLTAQKIKTAFMTKALQWHPDKAPTQEDVPVYTKYYEDIQEAYKILSNEDSRRQYTDSQQATNLDLTRQDRDFSYQKSDQYGTVTEKGYQFDRQKFVTDFEMTRDKEDRKIMEEITERAKMPVTSSEYDQYLKSREQDVTIPNVFKENGSLFNSSVFNQAFEYVKQKQPSRGLEEFVGEPVASGLAELDDGFAGINFGSLSLTARANEIGTDIGVAFNPDNLDFKMFTESVAQIEDKLTQRDIDERIRVVQSDRDRLAKIQQDEFIREPSEIEKLYAGLFKEMTEGLSSKTHVN
jgi:curved DNA-binding protein CbpA